LFAENRARKLKILEDGSREVKGQVMKRAQKQKRRGGMRNPLAFMDSSGRKIRQMGIKLDNVQAEAIMGWDGGAV